MDIALPLFRAGEGKNVSVRMAMRGRRGKGKIWGRDKAGRSRFGLIAAGERMIAVNIV